MKNPIIRNAIILTAIALVLSVLLGFTNEFTKERIAEQETLAKQKAYVTVFGDGITFTVNDELKLYDTGAVVINEVVEARDASGSLVGYGLNLTTSEGYGGNITMAMGVKVDGTLTGIDIIAHAETPGLGANCTKDSFKSQFAGIQAEKIDFSKTGKTLPNEIDAISSATFTTRAVTGAVNAGLAFVNNECLK